MEKWRDYFWYLLPSPLKIVAKNLNQWYIFFKVIGDEFDSVQAELERAADETTIATCSDMMLPYFAEDRGLYRYSGESNDSFRSRIAMFDELESLGGTEKGIVLAAASVGYDNVEHIWLPELNGETERWATFLLRVYENLGDDLQLDFQILKREVRDKKESISQDTYEKHFITDPKTRFWSWMCYEAELEATYWNDVSESSDLFADYVYEILALAEIQTGLQYDGLFETTVYQKQDFLFETKGSAFFYDCRKLDGSFLLDGSYCLDAAYGKIEAFCGEAEL